jgi:rfaE bifunctional protein nucleotidyltransferase chain/domain
MIYSYEKKIVGVEEAVSIARDLRNLGKRTVTTSGCFDLLHAAHLHVLENAKDLGDYFFVLLNSDESVRRYKGDSRPFINQRERAELIAAIQCVDYVTIFNDDTPLKILENMRPSFHVKGGSYIPERVKAEEEIVERYGGKLVCFPLEEGKSSSNLANVVSERNGKQKDI